MSAPLELYSCVLLSTTNVPLNSNGATTLFTVPVNYRCVPLFAVVIGGAAANGTTLSIGQVGALTDFVGNQTLSNIAAQYDSVIIQPVPNATPVKIKSYSAGTVIQANIGSQAGGAVNSVLFFGILY